ncbi:MAG TPA: ABC transporter permease [Candidatus Latescibacteria bacterium]|jgi:ABC-2 type transport system permease protein|nr:ABC transporter permease [Gemmatimonadaceae bacterium]MDP6016542.1 ABC transporter permease [Candidatus Latescibacterota bacterium]HJP30315.1 ABC transporter permease [Candidatus Latescibacterota bacterium]|tara:strand:- start:90 stop:872 length:783 start_codon:yes stop_codon:yes gene_type:complete
MRNLLAIYSKELRSYFVSPVAYVIAGVFLFLTGYLFRNILMQFNYWCLQFSQRQQFAQGGMPNLNLNEMVVTQFFAVMDFIWLMVVPMITMRLFSEEKKSGTIELLMTSPVSPTQVLLGKFFAALSLYTAIVALTLVYCLILEAYGDPDWGPIWSAYLGYLLLGGTFIGVGVLASSLTENQIVAVLLAFGALLLLWLIDWSASFAGPTAAKILSYMSIIQHLQDFQRGVIDTGDVVFYLSFTFFTLFLTTRVLESRRWRR